MADENNLIGKKTEATPVKAPEIGIDMTSDLINTILDNVEVGKVDMNTLESFGSVSQTREMTYTLIDSMANDDRVSAILETYAEDATETNEHGQIVWCESSDESVNKYVSYLINSLDIDKYAYKWMYSLIKYGDVYLRLYRESDYGDDLLFGDDKEEKEDKRLNEDLDGDSNEHSDEEQESLQEDVKVAVHQKDDHYVHYVEMVPNPAEMFELTRFGKTMGYIQAPTKIQAVTDSQILTYNNYLTYKMKKDDVTVYDANDFVHASLDNDNSIRNPEEVTIFLNEEDYEANSGKSAKYTVKKGQSILYNTFRVWRELSLMENTILLNRITKSALVRILTVEVGDMPQDQVRPFIQRLKEKIEQKSAINVGKDINEYNNPGPIENTIYIPTHEGVGAITATTIGDDFDPKQLTDLDYFQNKFYGALRVPKQFFNQTDDSTGFNGGTSLAIISSRYGKAIKKHQNIFCQMITDLINIFLYDKKLKNYVNKFKIRMQAPVTQEEIDRRENMRNRMGVVNDVMSQINGVVKDEVIKLKIFKSLIADTVTNPEVIGLLQEQIDKMEEEGEPKENKDDKDEDSSPKGEPPVSEPSPAGGFDDFMNDVGLETEEGEEEIEAPTETEDSYLPSPDEMNLDLTGNI